MSCHLFACCVSPSGLLRYGHRWLLQLQTSCPCTKWEGVERVHLWKPLLFHQGRKSGQSPTYFLLCLNGQHQITRLPIKGRLGQGVSEFPASVEVAGEKRLQNSWTVTQGMLDTHTFSKLTPTLGPNSWLGGPFLGVVKESVKLLALNRKWGLIFAYWYQQDFPHLSLHIGFVLALCLVCKTLACQAKIP